VNNAGAKGLFLVVDDVWPDVPELWFDLMEDMHYVFFKKVPITRVPEDGKLLLTLITVDQSHKDVELSTCLNIRVLRKPWDMYRVDRLPQDADGSVVEDE
jgi:hypothetical protein